LQHSVAVCGRMSVPQKLGAPGSSSLEMGA